MRYKIKVPSDVEFREVRKKLQEENIQLFVVNEKRHTLSTGNIPDSLLAAIEKCGGTVSADQRYALEER